jgi:ribose/xylose/arabinose/galactoside ABC-type transport system permease subunit
MNNILRGIKSGDAVKRLLTNYMLLLIMLVIFVVFTVMLPSGSFASGSNVLKILQMGSVYSIVILGVTWVISMNEIDASFGDVAAFSAVFSAWLVMKAELPVNLAVVISIICGSIFGLLNGILVTKAKLNSLIVTIAVSGIAKSSAYILGRGSSISVKQDRSAFFYQLCQGMLGGVFPTILLFVIVLLVILFFIQEKTKFGQYIYAIGDNQEAANVAGINTNRIKLRIFYISSLFAAFGGTMMMLRGAAMPTIGSNLFLESFTKIFIGATVFKLGKTNILGTFAGAVLMAMLVNGLVKLGAPSYMQQIITGLLLLVGVVITSLLQKRRQKSLLFEE